MKRNLIYVVAILSLTSCNVKEKTKMDRIVPVKTQTICGYANKQETSYVGTVEESSAVSLSFPVMESPYKM